MYLRIAYFAKKAKIFKIKVKEKLGRDMKKILLISVLVLAISIAEAKIYNICFAADFTKDPNCMGAWMLSADGNEPDVSGKGGTLTETSGDIPLSTNKKEGATSRDFEKADSEWLERADGGATDISGANQPISICCWYWRESDTGAIEYLVTKYDTTLVQRQYALNVYSDDKAGFSLSSNGSSSVSAYGAASIPVGSWTHIAGVYDDTQIKIYVNGILDTNGSNNPKSYTNGIYNGVAKFSIGSKMGNNVGSNFCDGLIDEAMVFNRALSADEVMQIYLGSVNQPPVIQASANPTNGQAPLLVSFTAAGTDSDGVIVSYSWDFGDGGISTEQNSTHIYNTPGTYQATVTVTDNDGATNSAAVTITVEAQTVSPGPVQKILRFQAKLSNTQATLLNGTYTLTFRLYDVETTGLPIWEEIQQDIFVEEGSLDVELGSETALNLAFDKQYWLSVEVESDGEMTPRFKLTTVPYSFRSFVTGQ